MAKRTYTFSRQVRRTFGSKAERARFALHLESGISGAERKARDGDAPCVTIRGGLDTFLRDSRLGLGRRKCSAKTRQLHRRRLEAFAAAFHNRPLDAIDRARLERWMEKRVEEVSGDTVNAELVSLFAFARWAQAKGLAPDILPLLRVQKLRVPGKLPGKNRKPPRARDMTELAEALLRLKEAREDMYLFLLGMAYYGLRPVAVAGLLRQDAAPARRGDGQLFVRGVKGAPDRHLAAPAGTPRAEWIRDCLAFGRKWGWTDPRAPLVPNIAGKSGLNPGGWTTASFDNTLRRLCRRLGIKLKPYDIRHSCMTWLLRHGKVGAANSQAFAGHERVDTQNAYNSLVGNEAEPAFRAIEREMGRLLGQA
jgi:integrase